MGIIDACSGEVDTVDTAHLFIAMCEKLVAFFIKMVPTEVEQVKSLHIAGVLEKKFDAMVGE